MREADPTLIFSLSLFLTRKTPPAATMRTAVRERRRVRRKGVVRGGPRRDGWGEEQCCRETPCSGSPWTGEGEAQGTKGGEERLESRSWREEREQEQCQGFPCRDTVSREGVGGREREEREQKEMFRETREGTCSRCREVREGLEERMREAREGREMCAVVREGQWVTSSS